MRKAQEAKRQGQKPTEKPLGLGRRKGASIRSQEHQLLVRHLVSCRKSAGLTQEELAEKVGKHQSHISRLEQSERDISVLDLMLWCQATGLRFSEFAQQLEQDLEGRRRLFNSDLNTSD